MYELTLSFPGRNALSTAAMNAVLEGLDRAGGAPLLLTGAGEAFSSGLNLKEVAALDAAALERFLRLLDAMMVALFTYPGPTAAAVNGHAIAGGCILALCCDVRVGSTRAGARIGINEVARGLRFPPRILQIVRQRVPVQHLQTLVLGAGLYEPPEALRLGLLDELADDPRARAMALLDALAAHPAEAYAAAKADLRAAAVASTPELERAFLEAVLPVWTADATRARIRAALAR